ncbi:MAG: hypothetical protein LRY76_03990 [Alphaproteobacteria bacterium]|nr:hypothetical protein [Alphaproteobacteria bacterium]MCD8525692.1 hypothetical protein [Alphaproteobacteria bacterium]MCD8570681.1 hypothetical protein [Alphaproteobacteria bacterium]
MAVLLSPVPRAGAAEVSGEYLINVCAIGEDGKEIVPNGHVTCQSYIAGVMDYHSFTKSLGVSSGYNFCIPEGTSLYDIHKKVLTFFLKNREQYAPFIASPGVVVALVDAYPCAKKKRLPKGRR